MKYGIIKICPPAGWKHPCQVDMRDPRPFPTNRQRIHTLQEGEGYTNGYEYTLQVRGAHALPWMGASFARMCVYVRFLRFMCVCAGVQGYGR